MTPPTQAQIIAARDAVWRECPEFTAKGKAERVAIAALTAAAGADDSELKRLDRLLTVRDEQLQKEKQAHFQCMRDKLATIERCIEALNNKWMGDETAEYFLRESLALLMALKDEK